MSKVGGGGNTGMGGCRYIAIFSAIMTKTVLFTPENGFHDFSSKTLSC